MRNYLCIILFFVLSLTIPATSAYAYGGGGGGSGGGKGGGGAGVKSTGSETINPPSGFKPVKQESADGDSNVLQNISEIKPSSETDPGKEEEVAELVNEVNIMEETAEETTSDEKAPDETTPDEDQGDEKNLSDDGTDKTGNITNGVRLFLSQLQQQVQPLPQGLQPAVDAVNQPADRTERVEHINNFFHDVMGLKPPDLSDDKDLVKWENIVKEAENWREIQKERERNLAAVAEHEKTRQALLNEREEQLEASLADYRSIVKFGVDATVNIATAGIGSLAGAGASIAGAGASIAYSAATSDNPVKGGAVQTVLELATYGLVGRYQIVNPFRSRVLNDSAVNFGLTKFEAAVEDGLGAVVEVLERQQQRDRFGQQTEQSIDRGVQSVPPSK